MRTKTLTIGTMGLAGLVTTGMLAFPVTSAFAGDDSSQTAFKRDDDTPDVVLVADDDDDDTNARGGHQHQHEHQRQHGTPHPDARQRQHPTTAGTATTATAGRSVTTRAMGRAAATSTTRAATPTTTRATTRAADVTSHHREVDHEQARELAPEGGGPPHRRADRDAAARRGHGVRGLPGLRRDHVRPRRGEGAPPRPGVGRARACAACVARSRRWPRSTTRWWSGSCGTSSMASARTWCSSTSTGRGCRP